VRLLAVAWGEIRQRLREPGFLLLLVALAALATYLAPAAGSPYNTLSVGRSGVFGGSALAGTASGMDFSIFAGFFCIFALGSGFARDDRTRLSELLRAQPLNTLSLVLGRVLSSWALGAVLAIGAMLLLGFTLVFREGAAFDPIAYARNFALLALPAMFVIASLAALLDILLGKWRGALIAVGIFGYIFLLSWTDSGMATGQRRPVELDLGGIRSVQTEFDDTFGSKAQLSGGLMVEDHPGKPIYWRGLAPTPTTVLQRAIVLGDAGLLGLLAAALYRRRAGTKIKGAQAIEPQRAGRYAFASVTAPVAGARGFVGRVAIELLFRVRKNPVLAIASAGLFALSIVGAQRAHHWVVAGAMLLPLFWIRAFDDALRPRSLDEALGSLRGGLAGDWAAKAATLSLLCVLPLAGLLIGNPGDPMVWVGATAGLIAEIAWLTATTWVFRAELLGLGVVALWWYVVAFNDVPPIDYAGLWGVSSTAIALDAIVAVALIVASQTLLRRRA
jgi:hypothetical protein